MSSVWAIEEGRYSDYHVVGVFSTKENAERVLAKLEYPHATISEWPLDPFVDELNAGLKQYRVTMLRDGTTEEVVEIDYFYPCYVTDSIRRSQSACHNAPDTLKCFPMARDEKHAVKIANETRTRFIAEGRWED